MYVIIIRKQCCTLISAVLVQTLKGRTNFVYKDLFIQIIYFCCLYWFYVFTFHFLEKSSVRRPHTALIRSWKLTHSSCTVTRSEETNEKSHRRETSQLSLWQNLSHCLHVVCVFYCVRKFISQKVELR